MQASQNFFAPFFENAPALFAIVDSQGTILTVNPSWERDLGYPSSRMVGRRLEEWVPEQERSTLSHLATELRFEPMIQRRTKFISNDGAAHLLSWMARRAGDHIYFAARDVTSEDRHGQIMERERLLGVFMKAPAPISIMYGPELVIQFANDAYRQVVGADRGAEGKPVEFAFPEIQPEIVDILKAVYQTGNRYVGNEFPIALDWGMSGEISTRHYNFVAEATRDAAGSIDGVITFSFDVSEQVLARETLKNSNAKLEEKVTERTVALSAANKELEAFSYSVSHDLRSPLRGIVGFSQALQEDYVSVLDDTGRKYLRYIDEGIQRMGQLIDDLLSLSRLSRTELTVESVDLSQAAHELAEIIKRGDPERKVEVRIEPGLQTRADPGLLRILLQNLILNAWKFTRKRPDAVIEIGRTERDGKTVFFVRDNGAGFDMAYIGKLFGAFQQLHSPEEGYAGTGIGLATARRIVNRHGGAIWAEGKVSEGATFYFML